MKEINDLEREVKQLSKTETLAFKEKSILQNYLEKINKEILQTQHLLESSKRESISIKEDLNNRYNEKECMNQSLNIELNFCEELSEKVKQLLILKKDLETNHTNLYYESLKTEQELKEAIEEANKMKTHLTNKNNSILMLENDIKNRSNKIPLFDNKLKSLRAEIVEHRNSIGKCKETIQECILEIENITKKLKENECVKLKMDKYLYKIINSVTKSQEQVFKERTNCHTLVDCINKAKLRLHETCMYLTKHEEDNKMFKKKLKTLCDELEQGQAKNEENRRYIKNLRKHVT